jgi:hypothetical protein
MCGVRQGKPSRRRSEEELSYLCGRSPVSVQGRVDYRKFLKRDGVIDLRIPSVEVLILSLLKKAIPRVSWASSSLGWKYAPSLKA